MSDAGETTDAPQQARGSVITVADFFKNYGETLAVQGLNFEVQAGNVLGMRRPNGAGETTTLRSLAGFLPLPRGRLTISGFDVVADPTNAKRCVAYVPDDPRLFESLTVWEHLEFMASVYRVADYAKKAEPLLEQF